MATWSIKTCILTSARFVESFNSRTTTYMSSVFWIGTTVYPMGLCLFFLFWIGLSISWCWFSWANLGLFFHYVNANVHMSSEIITRKVPRISDRIEPLLLVVIYKYEFQWILRPWTDPFSVASHEMEKVKVNKLKLLCCNPCPEPNYCSQKIHQVLSIRSLSSENISFYCDENLGSDQRFQINNPVDFWQLKLMINSILIEVLLLRYWSWKLSNGKHICVYYIWSLLDIPVVPVEIFHSNFYGTLEWIVTVWRQLHLNSF